MQLINAHSFIEFKKLIKTLVVANHTLNFNNISVSNAKKIKFKFFILYHPYTAW